MDRKPNRIEYSRTVNGPYKSVYRNGNLVLHTDISEAEWVAGITAQNAGDKDFMDEYNAIKRAHKRGDKDSF